MKHTALIILYERKIKTLRKNFGAKAILYPMPVLIIGTYDENGKANAMNAAWGGISEETQISICVDDGHKTAKNVVKTVVEIIDPDVNDKIIDPACGSGGFLIESLK